MARIAGVDIPNDKRAVISLTYIYGIGRTTAKEVLAAANVSEDKRIKDLSEAELNAIRKEVDKIKVEGDLRREVQLNIKRLMEIGCYRGSVIVKDCRCEDREQRRTQEREKAKRRQLPIRRSRKESRHGKSTENKKTSC